MRWRPFVADARLTLVSLQIQKKVTQRDSMRLDYDASKAALMKMQKKPPKDASKLMKAESMTQQTGTMYNMINQEAMSRMSFHIQDSKRFWAQMVR